MVARQPMRSIVVVDLKQSCRSDKLAPARQIVVATVALTAPTLLVFSARVGAEQNTARFQRCPELLENARQLLTGHMEQRCVGKDAIEIFRRQIELQKILAPDFTTAICSGQINEALGAVQADSCMTQFTKRLQVSPRSAAEVENAKRSATEKGVQEGVSILADVVIARALPETVSVLIIMCQCNYGCLREFDITEVAAGRTH